MKLDTFTEKFDRAVAASQRVALAAGYQEQVTEQMKLDVATAWTEAIAEFETAAREVMTAIARASVFLPDAGTMAERVDVLKKAVAKANADEIKRAQAEADKRFQGRV